MNPFRPIVATRQTHRRKVIKRLKELRNIANARMLGLAHEAVAAYVEPEDVFAIYEQHTPAADDVGNMFVRPAPSPSRNDVADQPNPLLVNLNPEVIHQHSPADGDSRRPIDDLEIIKRLAVIYMEENLSLAALSAVARLFFDAGHNVPVDGRTIVHTSREKVGDVDFIHLGLVDGIKRKLPKGITGDKIWLQLNADGTPIFKTNTKELWPILCRIVNCNDSEPFAVSLYLGKSKPPSVDDFLRPFMNEMKVLETEGLEFDGRKYAVGIKNISCDAPARQFLKCIRGHAGYCGCERCTQIGFHNKKFRAMTFPELGRVKLRTNTSFRLKKQPRHHLTGHVSPFTELKIDMINHFPLDYMHLVLLGVFKRLLKIWTGKWNSKWKKHALQQNIIQEIDRRLASLRFSYPNEFHRIPVSLKHIGAWKAVELRSLLLYTGPVIFKGLLSKRRYKHFLRLHLAIRMLVSPVPVITGDMDSEYTLADGFLKKFAYDFGTLYGRNHLIYNIHSLIHLARDCRIHGPLDSFSCFPFETYLNRLKKLVRSSKSPLCQMVKRISELDYIDSLNKTKVRPSIFNQWQRPANVTAGTKKDSFYMTDNNEVVKVMSVTEHGVTVKKLRNLGNLYKDPLESERNDVYSSYPAQFNQQETWPLETTLTMQKCWVFPIPKGGRAIFPLIHFSD